MGILICREWGYLSLQTVNKKINLKNESVSEGLSSEFTEAKERSLEAGLYSQLQRTQITHSIEKQKEGGLYRAISEAMWL